MLQFSANLGFLWTELPLPAAIMAAERPDLTRLNVIGLLTCRHPKFWRH